MNKEGLEALERIGKRKYQTTVANITGFERITISVKQDNKKDYQTIEKELKEYEKMKRIKGTTTLDNALEETLINACPNVAKKLKTLENIKVILKDFIEFNVIELPHINKVHYEIKIFENAIYVSKEEYDLLKEVFYE